MKYYKILTVAAITVLSVLMLSGSRAPEPLTEKQLYDKIRAQTVTLVSPENKNRGGTGFVLNSPTGSKFTITNAHVCKLSRSGFMVARLADGDIVHLPIVAISEETDLCALHALPGLAGLNLAFTMEMYEAVYIIGHPLLHPASFAGGYVNGRSPIDVVEMTEDCRGKNKRIEMIDTIFGPVPLCFIRVDANWSDVKIYPGNSGSAVVNQYGDVVGVAFAGNMANFGYFIPLDELEEFLLSE